MTTELTTQTVSKPRKQAAGPRISRKMQQVIALIEGTRRMTQKQAADQAGLSEFHVSRELRKPQYQALIAQRRAANISTGSLRASRRMVELLDAESEHVAAKVGLAILTTTNDIKPAVGPGVSVHVNSINGMPLTSGYYYEMDEPRMIEADAVSATAPDPRVIDHEATK